jgi:hypothetical protein
VRTASGVASGERKRSTSDPTLVSNNDSSDCMRNVAPLIPNCSSALRLAPTMRPSDRTAMMPSISVPMKSTRPWNCSRITLRRSSFSHWFSIMRADI